LGASVNRDVDGHGHVSRRRTRRRKTSTLLFVVDVFLRRVRLRET